MIKNLHQYAIDKNIEIVDCELPVAKLKGLYCDNVIYLSNGIETERERHCILAEELGHYETSSGIILDNSLYSCKQEVMARDWAYQKVILLDDLVAAYYFGCRSRYEVAEFLNVTEGFLVEAIACFARKYGRLALAGDCAVYFEPLGVMEMF